MTSNRVLRAVASMRSRAGGTLDVPTVAALGLALVLWASAFAGIRAALTSYSPGGLALVRLLVGSLALGVYAALVGMRLPKLRHVPLLVLLGGVGIGLYQVALNFGERTVDAGTASLLVATVPLFTAVLAAVVLRERLGIVAVLGIVTGFGGAAVIASANGNQGLQVSVGALLVLLAALSESVYFVLQKSLIGRYSGPELGVYTVWGAALLALGFLPAAIHDVRHASAGATLAAVYLGVFPSAVSYVAWSWALARVPASRAASSLYLLPVFAIVVAWFWLGEIPTILAFVGGGITIAGVALTNAFRTTGDTRSPARSGTRVSPGPRA